MTTKLGTRRQNIFNGSFLPGSSADATRDPAFSGAVYTSAPIKQSLCYAHPACSGSMNAGAQALLSAELGGEDFFGYFLSHKKVTISAIIKDLFTGVLCLRTQAWEDFSV
ncbi:MAG: hypothetical protein KJ620_09640 [Candidatus Edwardsbacteria bacterium]|nr:hypothetical protein [Candidatus Edwardsbacteria bacterium]MBU1576841.1 hypothetical protein [Candidatus Edwardsbacteria bacterium]MBU2463818.1 hypothetical protein [Candidatus Edwardsbacteria bacterium]